QCPSGGIKVVVADVEWSPVTNLDGTYDSLLIVGAGVAGTTASSTINLLWQPGVWGSNTGGSNIIPVGGTWNAAGSNQLAPGARALFRLGGQADRAQASQVTSWDAGISTLSATWADPMITTACGAVPVTAVGVAAHPLP
ncbi:MAG: hypothetical protein ABI310_06880, partial [Microbacteriaceae bacterium]